MGGGGIPIVSDVVDVVGDVVGDVVDVVGDVGSFIDDAVIQPALDDPIKTAATVGAIAVGGPAVAGALGTSAATGAAIAGGLTTAGTALASGADLDDALKAGAIGAAAGSVGGTAAGAVGAETGSQLAASIAGGAAAGGTGAALTGNSIEQGLLSGGLSGGISSGVGTLVNAGTGLLNQATSGTTMDDFSFSDFIAEDAANLAAAGYDEATIAQLMSNNYGLDPYAATNLGSVAAAGGSLSDLSGLLSADYGSDLTGAAASAGINTGTLNSLLKQFGTSAVKSLLGIGGGQGGVRPGQPGTAGGTTGGLLGGVANYYLSNEARQAIQNASQQASQQQTAAAQQAQQQASFRPVGMTTAFGTSQFQVDPATGQLTAAGYTASPELAAQRERLFGLGASALPTTTDTQALQQQYITQQQGLLAPGREQQLAQLRNRQFQRGTTGLATGGTMAGYAPNAQGLMATNPEMSAYYNSLARENATLAANAPINAQNLLNQQIATGTGLFGAANTLEGYAQQPLTLAANLSNLSSTAGARAGQLGLLGTQTGINTALQGNIAAATGQLGQQQAIAQTVNPLLQSVGNSFLNWIG
jgi:energy-coupling factor transporter ATP-binding protein EcfA2